MKTIINIFRRIGFVIFCITILGSNVYGTTYTAIASGDFNAGTTWAGGIAPGAMLTSDIVIIPVGYTVTMTSDETFSGTASLTVSGTLTSASYMSALVMAGTSTLSGGGVITIDSMSLGIISGVTFVGTLTTQKATSMGASIASAANITVVSVLRLQSGVLSLGAGTLVMSPGSTIELSGGSIAVGGSAIIDLHYAYNVSYVSSPATSGVELTGSGLGNVTVNVPGAVTMSSDVLVNGNVMLTAGNLSLNNYKLTFGANGDFSASGAGAIHSTATSGIVINTTNSLTGALRFTTTGSTIGNFTVNFGNNTSHVNLGSSLWVSSTLSLQSGRVVLGANNLYVVAGGSVAGGTVNSFVVTDGTGKLSINLVATTTAKFDVGTALSNYTPVVITANSGSGTGDVGVNVIGSVYANGTSGTLLSATQPVVNNTWYVTSTASGLINYDMQVMWNVAMEVNGFDRTHAYISHYMAGAWDIKTASAATVSSGMYSMTRTGITSLSPFTVADINTFSTKAPIVTANVSPINIYPNPATSRLYFDRKAGVDKVYIIGMDGHLAKSTDACDNSVYVEDLQAGYYSIYFVGKDYKEGHVFVKQ